MPLKKYRMHLFVDISSHGFGHLAIIAPVLNALAEIAPNLRLTVRTLLPPQILLERIHHPFVQITASSDFGYVMIDATQINHPSSAAAYRQAHADWPSCIGEEARFLRTFKPDLVLTNVSYLPLAGAEVAGIPALSLCSLNWADLFAHFFSNKPWAAKIHREILAAYRSAQTFLRMTPGMPMRRLGNVRNIGSIARIGQKHELRLQSDRGVLIAMGGIMHRLPVENWREQDCLIDWLQRNIACIETPPHHLQTGALTDQLAALWQQPSFPWPQNSGAAEAAAKICSTISNL